MPRGDTFHYRYLPYEEIPANIEKLFTMTQVEMRRIYATKKQELDDTQVEQIVKLTARFLNQFLFIHPYTNGNGRTARILASYLLSGISVVPVSLTEGSQNNAYFNCLREVHSSGRIHEAPTALATLILERVFLSLENFYKTLIIEY